jgi:hypothetical protein
MRVLKVAAMVLGIMGGYLGLASAPASAAPFGTGAAPLAQLETPLVAQAQWGHRGWHGGYRRGWGGYGYRRHWGGPRYGYYGWGGPRFVCRWRPTPWGPRRVCFRRW